MGDNELDCLFRDCRGEQGRVEPPERVREGGERFGVSALELSTWQAAVASKCAGNQEIRGKNRSRAEDERESITF